VHGGIYSTISRDDNLKDRGTLSFNDYRRDRANTNDHDSSNSEHHDHDNSTHQHANNSTNDQTHDNTKTDHEQTNDQTDIYTGSARRIVRRVDVDTGD